MRVVVAHETPFGRVAVLEDMVQRAHILLNDATWHGWQFRDPDRLDEPAGYYSAASPIAEIFRALSPRARVAVVGLGAGVMASLGAPGHTIDFYELNPAVVEVARDASLFSYLARTRSRCEVIVGDAVERITEAPARAYDLIAIDAFNGDEVSGAVLSREAVARFVSRLARGAVIAFHITSTTRGDDHRPVIARAAEGMACAYKDGRSPRLAHDSSLEIDPDVDLSMPVECRWAVTSPERAVIDELVRERAWTVFGT